MKLQIKKISIYCLIILGILLVNVIPVMAQDVNAAQTITDAAKAGPQNVAETIKNFLITKGTAFAVDLLAAILIFVIGRWLAKWASLLVGRAMTRAHVEQILVTFVQHLCYFGLLAFVIIAALDQIGIKLTAAIAVLGAAALAVAFALQGSLSNFAAGILMVIFKPFKIGDYVTVAESRNSSGNSDSQYGAQLPRQRPHYNSQRTDNRKHYQQLYHQRYKKNRFDGWHIVWRRHQES